MVKFTTIAAGGVDYYQENKPASGKNGELWLPVTETTYDDGTTATGVTEDTTVSHSLHSNSVQSVHASNGVVYSGSGDNTVKAVDASDGSQLWSHSLHSNFVWSVHASNGVVYSGSGDDTVKAVDASDGTELWSHSLHSGNVQSVHASNGVVYSGSYDDTVKAVDASDGTELWSHSLHSKSVESVHASNGVVYSGSNDNTVKAAEIDGITFAPADGGTSTPQLYYNGEWLQSQNAQTSGGSY